MSETKNPSLTPEFHDQSDSFDHAPSSIGTRLRTLRKAAGLSQKEVGQSLDVQQSAVARYEKDAYRPTDDYIQRFAELVGGRAAWITYGEGDRDNQGIPVLGYIGAGGGVYPITSDADDVSDYIEAPFDTPADAIGLHVKGESMQPYMEDSDIVIYRRDQPFLLHECINRRCVVHLDAGMIMVKKLKAGTLPGLFNLESTNAETIENVAIKWAAPILGIVYR